jgi:hypothetical protein
MNVRTVVVLIVAAFCVITLRSLNGRKRKELSEFMKYLRVAWAIVVEIVTHPFEDGYLMFDKDGRLKERL